MQQKINITFVLFFGSSLFGASNDLGDWVAADNFDVHKLLASNGSLLTVSVDAQSGQSSTTEIPQVVTPPVRGHRKRTHGEIAKEFEPALPVQSLFQSNARNGLRRIGVLVPSDANKLTKTLRLSLQSNKSRDKRLRDSASQLSSEVVRIAGYPFPVEEFKHKLGKKDKVVVPLPIAEQPRYLQARAEQDAAAQHMGSL